MVKLTEYYKQRAKKHWAINGDGNTTYFHHAVLKRSRRKKRIASIKDDNGVVQVEQEKIANTFIQYFRNLFPLLTIIMAGLLSTLCNRIWKVITPTAFQTKNKTLKAMRRNASPGPDGFNVEFYLGARDWIGDDITKVVRDFYTQGILPTHLNDTHIALVPKN